MPDWMATILEERVGWQMKNAVNSLADDSGEDVRAEESLQVKYSFGHPDHQAIPPWHLQFHT